MSCTIFDEDCLDFNDCRKLIKVAEQKSTYLGDNKKEKEFCLYHVDDCIVKTQDKKKCDYLLLSAEELIAYFIELKGSDLIKAVDQINATLDALGAKLNDWKWNARIVLTRTNTTDLRDSKYIKLKKRLKKKGGTLESKSKILKEKL
jgi:hypothetical protein